MIVLDTHAWLWWASAPEHLSKPATAAIDSASSIGVCTLSAWEIAMLATRGRITLDRDVGTWVKQALADSRLQAIPPSTEVAVAAGVLDPKRFHGDPVDRMIYACAHSIGATLVTRDKALRKFDPKNTLW